MLTFQAKRFSWVPFHRVWDGAGEAERGEASDAVVAFVHVEGKDVGSSRRASVFRQSLKHIKWLANKRKLRTIVLHSFTHLGGESAPPEAARAFLEDLAERLRHTGYIVHITPFGWVCEWELHVYGESIAKVWKAI